MKPVLFMFIAVSAFISCYAQGGGTFEVDRVNNRFLMDGEPFRYVAGSFHYFRAHNDTWRDKLQKMRASGLNAVDIYVQWSLHNPKDDVYDFSGIADVERFIEIAEEEDLYIILRPGPYICAEIDNGGLPYWLATKYPDIQVRTSDANYLREVEKWYDVLMPKFEGHFYGNGGKIIMVQIENEYGAFKVCDKGYKDFLKELTFKYTQDHALLFTTDRPIDDELKCGQVEDVFVTTDFGIASEAEVTSYFNKLREVQPNGPLVNSEFYTGWLTHWQEPNARRGAAELAATLRTMLDLGASVNFYMFFGGTNYGFWAGANDWGIGKYMADITSYDYDAPLSEPGDLTPKYHILRSVIGQYLQLPPLSLPDPSAKRKYSSISVAAVNTIFSQAGREHLASAAIDAGGRLRTFEELDQFSGFVLYETHLPKTFSRDPANLVVEKFRDRALIYVDERFAGVLSRENAIKSLPVNKGHAGKKLQILVENQGRINFQENFDLKGILGNVTLQIFDEPYYAELSDWTITGYPFENYGDIEALISSSGSDCASCSPATTNGWLKSGPAIFKGTLIIGAEEVLADTWWNVRGGWGKGSLFVNGVNLGRYWSVGPQMTMYIAKEFLRRGDNDIVILELQKAPRDLQIHFTGEADYNEN